MWEIDVGNQVLTFLYSLVLGAIMCVCYDFLRTVRKYGLNSFSAVFITDISFWAISGIVTFIFLISRTNGEVRGYVIISELTGFLIFRILLSRFILPIFDFAVKKAVKIFTLFSKLFYSVFEKAEAASLKIAKIMLKKLKSGLKCIKKLLKNRHKVLYTNENTADAEYVLNET